ncbi:MAG: hypothetical protein KDC95_13760 [Planctomycetes bacterium]|nr:hypothetical protein [Planctomycetota bacterium]
MFRTPSCLRHAVCGSLGIAILSSVAYAQTPREAWQSFTKDHGPNWTVDWNPATETPRAIYGPGLEIAGSASTLAEARRRANRTLADHAALLGRGASTFVEASAAKMGHVWAFVYRQEFSGLEVIGGRADVRVHETGGISMFGSTAFALTADFDVQPAITKSTARIAAYNAHGGKAPVAPVAVDEVRLVVWGDVFAAAKSEPHLAWEVHVEASTKITGRSYVDAKTGVELRYESDYHECGLACSHASHSPIGISVASAAPQPNPFGFAPVTGKVVAWTNTGLRPTDPLTLVPMENIRVQVIGGNTGYTDANGDFNIAHTGTTAVQVDVQFVGTHVRAVNPQRGTRMSTQVTATPGTPVTITIYSASAIEDDRAQSTGYWCADDVNTWLTSVIGTLPTLIDGVTVNTSLPQSCNAFFRSNDNSINFYNLAGSCNMTCYTTVVYHEWGHAIDNAYGGISQTDGLSEGWGDLVATYRTGQPIVGDAFFLSGGSIRTALNTFTYPAGGEVHQQGQTWMGFAWDVRENLRNRKGSAGVTIAEKIVLSTLAGNARNQPDAVREVFLADDDDNNLDNGTPNYLDLEAAAKKRALPYPQKKYTDPGSYTTYGTGCLGTGSVPTTCASLNTNGSLLGSQGYPGVRYMLEVTAGAALQVQGFSILQASRTSGNVTVPTYLYSANASGQPDQVLATGSMTVGSASGLYDTRLNQVVSIASGQKFFIGFQNANPTITVGTLSSGTIVPYWRNNGTGNSWVQFTTRPWAYQILCATTGGAVPALSHSGSPVVGVSFSVDLAAAATSVPAVLVLGASNTSWNSITLPLDLTAAGAKGCSLVASADFMLPLLTSTSGAAVITINVPNDPTLYKAQFYNQFIVADPKANSLGFAFSNGGAATLGKQ